MIVNSLEKNAMVELVLPSSRGINRFQSETTIDTHMIAFFKRGVEFIKSGDRNENTK